MSKLPYKLANACSPKVLRAASQVALLLRPAMGLLAALPVWATIAITNGLLFFLIAGMAGSCDATLLKEKFTTRAGFRGIMSGLVCQFVLLPFLGFLALTIFPQPAPSAIALLVVTTSPGGGFSGLWCYVSNADLALSVAMTTASTLVSVVALPLNLAFYVTWLYGRSAAVDVPKLLASCALVIAAVGTGYSISRRWPRQSVRQAVSAVGSTAGVCHMLFGGTANATSETPMWEHEWSWFAAVCLPVLCGLSLAMLLAKYIELPNPQAVAVAIECCYQNVGLALTIALSAMPREDAAEASGVPLVYGVVEIAVIPLFAMLAWKRGWTYAPPETNLCVAVAGNFQPTGSVDMVPMDPEEAARVKAML